MALSLSMGAAVRSLLSDWGGRPAEPDVAARWRAGDLTYKLRPVQLLMYKAIKSGMWLKFVLNCSRRIGKSYLLCIIAIECCLRVQDAQVRFAAPTQKMLRKIILPIMREICKDAPEEMRPVWKSADSMYFFPSKNAELHLSGCNNGHDENLRGTAAHMAIVDEAGIVKALRYLVNDILMPQLLTTNGILLMASSAPRTPAHEFCEYAQESMVKGNYAEFDIHQSGYSADTISKFCEEAGGPNSTTWLREYLCKFVVDSQFAIIPEWRGEFEAVVERDEFFRFYHKYAGMDLGVRLDFTAVLFGFYEFKKARLVIEDEFVMKGPDMTTDKLVKDIRDKERALWDTLPVYRRISDNDNPLLIQDMATLHNISFLPVQKDTLEAMVNELRLLVNQGRLYVNPKCKQIVGCLRYGIWDDNRKKFARSVTYGHFDALAALIYLVRYLDTASNPIPTNLNISLATHHVNGNGNGDNAQAKAVRQILNIRRRK